MPELTVDDVIQYTNGRLEDNEETERMLAVALATARRYAGWHVSPVILGDEVTLDGPDSRILWLPTKKLVELNSVEEDGFTVSLTDLRWSATIPESQVRMRKRSTGFWSGDYQAIVVDMDHGYTEDEAADWRQAILTMVDQMASVQLGVSEIGLRRKRVDDVEYEWDSAMSMAAKEALTSVEYLLNCYRLAPVEFL